MSKAVAFSSSDVAGAGLPTECLTNRDINELRVARFTNIERDLKKCYPES